MRTFFTALVAATLTVTIAKSAALGGYTTLAPVADTSKNVIKSSSPYPAIPASVARLFYLQRDPNANTIVYELNAPDGKLDTDEPVHPYWIRYTEKGKKEELGYIQRKFAYGVSAKATGNDHYDIRLAAYKKFPLTLMKGSDGKYHIFATISKRQAVISRIFVKIEGGTFWFPNVIYIEILATDTQTGKEVLERFKP